MLSMFSIIGQSFRMSLQNIINNKMRSFLTMLGIIIGVASVIALVTIVQGATGSMISSFSSLGTDTLSVMAQGNSVKRGLTEKDMETLSEIEGVKGIAPSASLTTSVGFNNEVFEKVTIDGKDLVYFQNSTEELKSGRKFLSTEMDGFTNVCIVDETFVEKVLSGSKAIGSEISVAGFNYLVIGITEESESIMGGFSDNSDSNGSIIIPYKNALAMNGAKNASSITVYLETDADKEKVEEDLRDELTTIFNSDTDAFSVVNMDSLVSMLEELTGTLSALLGGIASIALVVGGIGIMNMMLVSVSERTKEIGLRKALGAEPRRIQFQFLIESIVLSLLGGVIGIILGESVALVAAKLMETEFAISTNAIVLGVSFSIGVGVLFGWMPAKRASELNPIDALRSE